MEKNSIMEINIPKYEDHVLRLQWEDGFVIKSEEDGYGPVVISANSAGLVSLARILLTLAQDNVPEYEHLHLDEYGCLEPGSKELIIVKRNFK